MVRRHALDAAAVGRGTDLGGDLADQGREALVVSGRGRGDDAVAVEKGLGEDPDIVGGVFQVDGILLQPEVGKNLLGGSEKGRAVGVLRIELREREEALSVEQQVRMLDDAGQPLGRRDDLVDTDFAVSVAVDQLQGLLVELQSVDRAAQDSPELAVELAEADDILAAGNLDADRPADRGEIPLVLVGFLLFHIGID